MKLLDERGIGTVWSICKEKFALVGHTHNYAGSGSPGGSANSAIGVVDYNQTGKTIQIGYSGTGITGDQIKYIAGYTDGSGNVNAKIKDVSKDALKSWLGLGSLAYSSSSIPTKLSQLNNDKGFVTGSVSGNTVTINGASTTWTNTWRGIQDNLTSTSTSESLSANQGRVLKGLIDNKVNSSDLSSYAQKYQTLKFVKFNTIKNGKQYLGTEYADETTLLSNYMENASPNIDGCMSKEDKVKLDGIATGANNYTLPVATASTLGGIKTSVASGNGTSWPVCSYSNGTAFTWIPGLNNDGKNLVTSVTLNAQNCITNYNPEDISILRLEQSKSTTLLYPTKSGTFALTSDIPDVSSLCSFNFIDSISKCKSGRINFLFKNSNDYVDLSFLNNLEEGTILLIYSPRVGFQITNKGDVWYYNGKATAADDTTYINHAILVLAFFYNTYVYVSTFGYN